MRLGVDASMLTPRRAGVGNYVFNLLVEMTAMPIPPEIVLYSARTIAHDCKQFGVCVEQVGPRVKNGPLWLSTSLTSLLKRDRVTVFWGAQGYVPLLRQGGVRTVATIYDHVDRFAGETMDSVGRWTRRVFQPLSIRRASAVVAISSAVADEVKRYHGRDVDAVVHPRMDPIFLVPADAGVRARVKAKYDLPERFLLSLGTLEPRKNLKILLSAYAAVAASAPLPTLVLAGNRGWLDGDIQAMVQALQDAGRVRWLGFVAQEDLPSLYALSELFVFVPTYEGFGMPVREAALCGASVLASDIPSVREAGGSWPRYIPPDEGSIRDALKTHAMAPAKSRASSPVRLSEIEVGSAAKFMEVLNGGTVEVRR